MTIRIKTDFGGDAQDSGMGTDWANSEPSMQGDPMEGMSPGERASCMDQNLRTRFDSCDSGGFGAEYSSLAAAAASVTRILKQYSWFRGAKPGVCHGRPCVMVTVTQWANGLNAIVPRVVRGAHKGSPTVPVEIVTVDAVLRAESFGRAPGFHGTGRSRRTSLRQRTPRAHLPPLPPPRTRAEALVRTKEVQRFLIAEWCRNGRCPPWLCGIVVGLCAAPNGPSFRQALSVKVIIPRAAVTRAVLRRIPSSIEGVPIRVFVRAPRPRMGADDDTDLSVVLGPHVPPTFPPQNRTGYSDETVGYAQELWDAIQGNAPPTADPSAPTPPPSLFVQGPPVPLEPLESPASGSFEGDAGAYGAYGNPLDPQETLATYGEAFRHWRSRGGEFGDEGLGPEMETGLAGLGYGVPVQMAVMGTTTALYTGMLALAGVKGWWLLLGLPLGLFSGAAALLGAVAVRASQGDPKAAAFMTTLKGASSTSPPALPAKA